MLVKSLKIGVLGAIIIDLNKSRGLSYRFLGGGGLYSSVSLVGIGVETILFTSYGPDIDPKWIEKLQAMGVKISARKVERNIVFENLYKGSSRIQRTWGELSDRISVDKSMFKGLHAVHVTPVLNEIDYNVFKELVEAGCKISIDVQGFIRSVGKENYVINVKRLLPDEFLRYVDYIHMSLEEQLFFLENDVRELFDLNPNVIVEITYSDHGSFVMDRKTCYRIPAFKTEAIDPTGAGDVYAAVFLAKHIEKESLLEAGLYASASASIKAEKAGPLFILNPVEIERRVDLLKRDVENLY
ncbi:MAG: PfkB family carbohydrate kinase [Crenarchaeota archaeon]|nr:PfkB family carbohydrate kinase [Thermoproteota archaeon]MDW8034053.1 PfkB family carbohydrate kinase [Nitrososphaerota archaeon]